MLWIEGDHAMHCSLKPLVLDFALIWLEGVISFLQEKATNEDGKEILMSIQGICFLHICYDQFNVLNGTSNHHQASIVIV